MLVDYDLPKSLMSIVPGQSQGKNLMKKFLYYLNFAYKLRKCLLSSALMFLFFPVWSVFWRKKVFSLLTRAKKKILPTLRKIINDLNSSMTTCVNRKVLKSRLWNAHVEALRPTELL